MQNTASRPLAQTLLGVPAVVVIGGIAAAMNWRFGQTLGHSELDGYLFGALGVALVALNWIMPGAAAFAASRKARLQQAACIGLWLICAAYTLVSSVGFSALHRAENASGRQELSERYTTAKADYERLTGELAAMKSSPKYTAASGCADARWRQADFCADVKTKEAEIKAAKSDMEAGRPASVDPQAETLARLTGFDVPAVSTALAVAVAVVMELVSSLGFFAVAHAAPLPGSPTPIAQVATPSETVTTLKSVEPRALTGTEAARALASRPRPSRRKALPAPDVAAQVKPSKKRKAVKV
jgi:hypothetical protein